MTPGEDRFDEVLGVLGEGVDSPLPYTALLRLLSGDRGHRVLTNLGAVATRLRDTPMSWGALIRHRDWRHTIVGCSAALLARDGRFLDDLLDRFRRGSWVSPQLAVALGIVHPAEAVAEFEPMIVVGAASCDPKRTFSAYTVLKLLGRGSAEAFEAGDMFRESGGENGVMSPLAREADFAVDTVKNLWVFWKATSISAVTEPRLCRNA